jgi:hypothetical protein
MMQPPWFASPAILLLRESTQKHWHGPLQRRWPLRSGCTPDNFNRDTGLSLMPSMVLSHIHNKTDERTYNTPWGRASNMNFDDWLTVPHALHTGTGHHYLTLPTISHMVQAQRDANFLYKYNVHAQYTSTHDDGDRHGLWNIRHQLHTEMAGHVRKI